MAQPRRTIPALLDDPRAVALTLSQRHTLVLLPLALDDDGRALDDPGRLNGILWGSLWREHGPAELDADLDVLAGTGHVLRYEVAGARFVQMLDWDVQQVISRRAPSRFPAPSPEQLAGAGAGPGANRRAFWASRSEQGHDGPLGDRMWASVEGLVDVVAGAAQKLHDPTVQSNAVSFLSDLAGHIDPKLSDKVRERASVWVGVNVESPATGTVAEPPAQTPAGTPPGRPE